jgi:two-component system nitrogen regulation sensor histidine kinase NtrY
VASAPDPTPSALSSRRSPRWWRRALIGARRANLFAWLEVAAAVALLAMLGISWLTIAGRVENGSLVPSGQAAAILVGTLIPALGLIVLVGRRLAIRRAGGTTARLHVNLVFFFSLIAAIPTLLVAVFASFLFQSGVEFWFSADQRGILEDANDLAEGYYDENQRDIANNGLAMVGDLRAYLAQGELTDPGFELFYAEQVYYRELNESAILQLASDGSLRTVAVVDPAEDVERERVSRETFARLRSGEDVVPLVTPERIEAVTPIDRGLGLYLYIARHSNADALAQYERALSVVDAYDTLTRRARVLQLRFNVALFAVSLFLVGLAVWAALRFADRQVKPLAEVVNAAREIGAGNYAMRVTGRQGQDEIGLLNRAFNRMSAQIERQTAALIGANRQLAERRAFMEAVLQSISAGIVSLDGEGRVRLMNASAEALLLGEGGRAPLGEPLESIAPELAALVREGARGGRVQYSRDGELLTLAVKLASAAEGGCVITFEDITRQLLDQRQAAWSDVARRIAHEIKNPLTPIQLATERLNRRYRKQIEHDGELFDELTGTIIRQVGDLKKMVDEFSSFARLPKPVFRPEDPVNLVRQALFLQEVAHPEIRYTFESEGGVGAILCDRHQLGQAMTNVLKNAAEAIDAQERQLRREEHGGEEPYRGAVAVRLTADAMHLAVTVTDNGIGLPGGGDRIMEPYVTTREKGTGLGLAIVKKIVEEHGGDLVFAPAAGGGARATLRFARDPAAMRVSSEAAE